MEKKITYFDLINSESSLRLMSNHDFGDSSFNIDIALFIRDVDKLISPYFDEYNKLVTKYGEKKGGQCIVPFNSPMYQEFDSRVKELQSKEITVNVPEITKEKMMSIKGMAAVHFISTQWIVDCLGSTDSTDSTDSTTEVVNQKK